MDKKLNNAESTLLWDLQASNTTSLVVATWEWALFWTVFPIEVKRETITISWRSGDVLTIGSRASQLCVQDDSAVPKTRTQNALSFLSWDRIYISITEKDSDDLNAIINLHISTWWSNNYEIAVEWVSEYYDWLKVRVKSDFTNTSTITLKINWLSVINAKKQQWLWNLLEWDYWINWIAEFIYNSTLWVFQFESEVANPVTSSAMELLDSTVLLSSATSITTWTFEAKNHLMIKTIMNWNASNAIYSLTFNWDTWANYSASIVRDWAFALWADNVSNIQIVNSVMIANDKLSSVFNVDNIINESKWLLWNSYAYQLVQDRNTYSQGWSWNDNAQITSITMTASAWNMVAWTRIEVYWAD